MALAKQRCKLGSKSFVRAQISTDLLISIIDHIRMDVIALRKGSGNISGTILLNGFTQEPISFRRCSGYVEQFGETRKL